MHIISKILTGLVALIHVYILILEMFLWESRGPKVFDSFPVDLFAPTKAMAANQGLYNGFLAAGLIWAIFFIKDAVWARRVATFFLLCVAVAGLYGAMTVQTSILFVQTVPAVLALISVWALRANVGR
jgi:putative membrane protein